MQIESFMVDNCASLHMMSKNQVTSVEKDTIRRSKETAVITAASGEGRVDREATVHVNESNVSVTMMLLEDSPAVVYLGLV